MQTSTQSNLIIGSGEVKDNIFVSVCKNITKISGYERDEIQGKDLSFLFENKKRFIRKFTQTESEVVEALWKHKNGLILTVIINFTITSKQHSYVCFTFTVMDITNSLSIQKYIENKTIPSLSTLDKEKERVLILESNGKFIYANPAFYQYTNLSKTEFHKKFVKNGYFTTNLVKSFEKAKSLKAKSYFSTEYEIEYPSRPIAKMYAKSFLVGEKENARIVLSIIRDITPMQQKKNELNSEQKHTGDCEKLKKIFLSNISHEFRSPMNGILGFTELLSKTDLNDEQQKYVQIIRQSCNHLLSNIDNILQISQIESGDIEVNLQPTNIPELLDEIIGEGLEMINNKHKNLNIVGEISPNLHNVEVEIDAAHIKLILTHLTDNAIKFSEKGMIRVGCEVVPEGLQFFVQDEGIGIAPDKQKLIFDNFRHANKEVIHRYGGTGLGLSIVYKLILLLNGNIIVESEEELGSNFKVTIPCATNHLQQTLLHNREIQLNLTGKNVLVVEDDEASMDYLSTILTMTNANILKATNGQQAIDTVKQNPVDLILMDIQLPYVDGLTAAHSIKKMHPEIPIIAQTAYAFFEEEAKEDSDCDDFLMKPVDRSKLFNKVIKLINKNNGNSYY